jgi:hypothetical protein
MLEVDAKISSPCIRTEQISATVDTATISRFPSHLHSYHPNLRTAFYGRFRESREPLEVSRERQVLDLLNGENGW